MCDNGDKVNVELYLKKCNCFQIKNFIILNINVISTWGTYLHTLILIQFEFINNCIKYLLKIMYMIINYRPKINKFVIYYL